MIETSRYLALVLSLCTALTAQSIMAQQTEPSVSTTGLSLASFNCARFTQERYLADFEASIHSSGYLRKDDESIEWHILEPIEDTTIIGPDADNLSPALSAMAPLLRSLLSGDWQQLEQFFAIELNSAEGAWQATLQPRQESLAEHLNSLLLSGDEAVDKIELYFANQDHLAIQLQIVECASLEASR
ncbi:outer membrane lipoprotein carrier protein LolA [Granulosicoccus antarcticus]|uniref:Outer membrane lipoprotein carrier protein LolA n=1 Tax=Granulosicoccus antarcticus IMCC3135 TaxID=1192854 RepID=A0A2Z2P1X1_9GAMM|nr:outer membrane lipoprotein carrier protein LolA [Granulosicoccus antarcticus]ASJ76855.1 hypothetical protein IMCC3135_34075 [Granulosicoccus antarcticus IMCC3135]